MWSQAHQRERLARSRLLGKLFAPARATADDIAVEVHFHSKGCLLYTSLKGLACLLHIGERNARLLTRFGKQSPQLLRPAAHTTVITTVLPLILRPQPFTLSLIHI